MEPVENWIQIFCPPGRLLFERRKRGCFSKGATIGAKIHRSESIENPSSDYKLTAMTDFFFKDYS